MLRDYRYETGCEECGRICDAYCKEPGSGRSLCEDCYEITSVACDSCGARYCKDDDSEILYDQESAEWECLQCRDHRAALARLGIY